MAYHRGEMEEPGVRSAEIGQCSGIRELMFLD
jgi:hypothetical protein